MQLAELSRRAGCLYNLKSEVCVLLSVHKKSVAQEPHTKSVDQCVSIVGAVEHRGRRADCCEPGDHLQEARGSLLHGRDGLRVALHLHLHALLPHARRQKTTRRDFISGLLHIQYWILS